MNRDGFMNELEALLWDISVEERAEALQYYSDYFADAGIENESRVLEELGSPKKVAEIIKAGLAGGDGEHQEYRETGYADTRFEAKNVPGDRRTYMSDTGYHPEGERKKRSYGKIILIAIIILCGAPVFIPLAFAAVAVVLSIVIAIAATLLAILITCAAIALSGIILAIVGIGKLVLSPVTSLMLIGAGLILGSLGVVGTVLLAKLLWITCTGIFRGTANLLNKLIHRKVA